MRLRLPAVLAAFLLATACVTSTPRPVVAPPFDTARYSKICSDVYVQELRREIDPSGLGECLRRIRAGAQDVDLRAWVRASAEYAALQERLAVPTLTTDRRVFLADGQPWTWKGVSAFALLARFARGEDISGFLAAYKGFNVLRVWPYVPRADWGAKAWDVRDVDAIKRFLARVRQDGWIVELTLLTDDDPARLAWAKQIIPQLAWTPGLVLEAGNEPQTHKDIDTAALVPALKASGLPWTTGDYEDLDRLQGTYGVYHSRRDSDWPRRAHDALDNYNGGPVHAGHHVPMVADEPPKLQDVHPPTVQDWRAYFAASALLGAGATFHSETGKYGLPPTTQEAQLAAAALEGLNAIPPGTANSAYRRIDEHGATLRTYVVGHFMVRIRPTTKTAPERGWTPLDHDGILFRR